MSKLAIWWSVFVLSPLLLVHRSQQLIPGCIVPDKECPNVNVTFWLYTRQNRNNPVQLYAENPEGIKHALSDAKIPLEVLIHGYTGNKESSPFQEITPPLFEIGEFNVISVDYSPLVPSPCYLESVQNLPLVGNCTAQFLDAIIKYTDYTWDNVHIIGHSLGGQCLNQVSKYLKTGKPKHVTALDPALPLFITTNEQVKLSKDDAEFVDVYHTDAGRQGKIETSGTVDFYMNWAVKQPACPWNVTDPLDTCSHGLSNEYYGESIVTKVGFYGRMCPLGPLFYDTCTDEPEVEMGWNVSRNVSGVYYVKTSDKAPYALGKNATEPSKNIALNAVKASYDKSAEAYNNTKQNSANIYNGSINAFKEASAGAYDKTKETSTNIFNKAKDTSGSLFDKAKETSGNIYNGTVGKIFGGI